MTARSPRYLRASEEAKQAARERAKAWYHESLEHTDRVRRRSKDWRLTHESEYRNYLKRWRRKSNYNWIHRENELLIIAQSWKDDVPRCRADLTPNLMDIPCKGRLQVDHMNGNGQKEHGFDRTNDVVQGRRRLDDLRVLCELHQWYHAILREDSPGGSDPKDWEE